MELLLPTYILIHHHHLPPPPPQDYTRNRIKLPPMNHSAEELVIDLSTEGFAIVSFVTKEDLDVGITQPAFN